MQCQTFLHIVMGGVSVGLLPNQLSDPNKGELYTYKRLEIGPGSQSETEGTTWGNSSAVEHCAISTTNPSPFLD